jgi:hypothetical protein
VFDFSHLFLESVEFFEHFEIGFFLGIDDGVASFEFVLSGFKVAVFVSSLEA